MGVAETLVGRQPIFDRDLAVRGYQLLFRSVDEPAPVLTDDDGRYLTPEGLLGHGCEGLGALVGTKRAFCAATPCIVTGETPILAPPTASWSK